MPLRRVRRKLSKIEPSRELCWRALGRISGPKSLSAGRDHGDHRHAHCVVLDKGADSGGRCWPQVSLSEPLYVGPYLVRFVILASINSATSLWEVVCASQTMDAHGEITDDVSQHGPLVAFPARAL